MSRQTTAKKYSWRSELSALVKFRLTAMVVLTSVIAYAISSAMVMDGITVVLLTAGGFFLTSGSNIINQVLEREYDRKMRRTADRPLAAQRMQVTTAVTLAGIASVLGMSLLAIINPICGILASLSFVLYAFIYTPMKRVSTVSVAIGAIPGALPVLIGCVASSGEITVLAVALFTLQFLWQFPHFWAIGYLAYEDYERAGFKLVPSDENGIDKNVGWYSTVYCIAIVGLSVWMIQYGLLEHLALQVGLLLSAIGFLLMSLRFMWRSTRAMALQLMLASIVYMPTSLFMFLLDTMI